jgi:hypothetical protein
MVTASKRFVSYRTSCYQHSSSVPGNLDKVGRFQWSQLSVPNPHVPGHYCLNQSRPVQIAEMPSNVTTKTWHAIPSRPFQFQHHWQVPPDIVNISANTLTAERAMLAILMRSTTERNAIVQSLIAYKLAICPISLLAFYDSK